MDDEKDQREAGNIYGIYVSAADRRDAGVLSTDNELGASLKVGQLRFERSQKAMESACVYSPSVPDPVFDDPAVRKAIRNSIGWVVFAVTAFCLAFFGIPAAFNKVVNMLTPKNSDNWTYEAKSNVNLARILNYIDHRLPAGSNTIKAEKLRSIYEGVYGSTLTFNQYKDIVAKACSYDECSDISLDMLRGYAVLNGKVFEFDKKTTRALTAHWNKVDSTNKYDYRVIYKPCPDSNPSCVNSIANYNYQVAYRNVLEKEVD